MGIPMGIAMGMGMGWVWGLAFNPHGSPVILSLLRYCDSTFKNISGSIYAVVLCCVYVSKKLKIPLFPQIVHNNSTPRRNHIFWAAFEYLYPFCIYGGSNFPFFHILWSWLLTQRIALPCIRVIPA